MSTGRWLTGVALVVACLAPLAGVVPAGATSAPPAGTTTTEAGEAGRRVSPQSPAERCPDGATVDGVTPSGRVICTHGDDGERIAKGRRLGRGRLAEPLRPTKTGKPAEADAGTGGAPGDASAPEPTEAAMGATPASVPCEGDGVSGPRVQIIYARAADRPDRFAEILPDIYEMAAQVDDIYNESAQQTGGHRHVRFVTGADCVLSVPNIVMPNTGDDSSANTRSALAAAGHNKPDRKYLTLVDADILCGVGQFFADDRPTADNFNNTETLYSRVDIAGFCFDSTVAAHELGHNFGAVQTSAPHASRFNHCFDSSEVMCYDDDGPNDGIVKRPDNTDVALSGACPAVNADRLDCGHDDYFHTSPPGGNYLATHWNVATTRFLGAPGVGEPPQAASAAPADSGATVTWTAPEASAAASRTGFRVRAWTGSTVAASKDVAAGATSATFGPGDGTGLANGVVHQVTVTALNSAGESRAASTSVVPMATGLTSVAISDAWITEPASGSKSMVFDIVRTGPLGATSSVSVVPSGGSAVNGADTLTMSAATVTFAAGEVLRTFTVGVRADPHIELAETVVLKLRDPLGTTVGDDSGQGTIWDLDAGTPATLSVEDTVVSEGAGSAQVTFRRQGYLNETVVAYALTARAKGSDPRAAAGADYTAIPQTQVKWLPGETVVTVAVPVNNDAVDEANEAFSVTLTAPQRAQIADDRAHVTIVDDDGPVTPGPTTWLAIDDVRAIEADSGSQAVAFTVRRRGNTSGTSTVNVATLQTGSASPADFTALASTPLSFGPNVVSITRSVSLRSDLVPEALETIVLQLSGATGAVVMDSSGQIVITDNDPGTPATFSVSDARVTEGDAGTTTLQFAVTRSGTTAETATVKVVTGVASGAGFTPAATAGSDYDALAQTTVAFSPGETVEIVTVTVHGDAVDEADEHLFLNLTLPFKAAVADARGVGTIVDDD